jgi:hypothetical protein
MIQTIRRTIKGMGYLDSCGDHPGTALLIAFLLMGGLAGLNKSNDIMGFATGAGLMGIVVAPLYLSGSYERGKIEDEMNLKRTLKQLAQEQGTTLKL